MPQSPSVPGRGGYRVPVNPSTGLPINLQNPPDFGLAPGQSGSSSGGTSGGNDWTHLMVRLAEFTVGAILIYAGIGALIAKSKTGRTVINVAAGTAGGGAGRAARQVTRAAS